MELVEQSFKVIQKPDAQLLLHLEDIGRICYLSKRNQPEDSAPRFIKQRIRQGHESILEHYCVTVEAITSRKVSHQIVRHRIAAYTQESTRFCDYSKDVADSHGEVRFVLPVKSSIKSGLYHIEWENIYGTIVTGDGTIKSKEVGVNSAEYAWFWACAISERDYKRLLMHRWPPEEAADVLNHALKTTLIMTYNLREWRHFFKMRCSPHAQTQTRMLALSILREFKQDIPIVFDDLTFQGE